MIFKRGYRKFWFLVFYFWFAAGTVHSQEILINELMASNSQTFADETGEFEDWIELYNLSGEDIDIGGYFVTDDLSDLQKFRLIEDEGELVVPANGFLLLWASGSPERGKFHLDFRLSSQGESFALIKPDDLAVVDSISFTNLPTDISYGRNVQDPAIWGFFTLPTPLQPNETEQFAGILEPPTANVPSGFYQQSIEVDIAYEDEDILLTYTTDGSEPTLHSSQWNGPLTVSDRSGEPNIWSTIPTNFIPSTSPHGFREPSGLVPKATVLRVKAFKSNFLPSESAYTYFVFDDGGEDYELPVFSMLTDSASLFSDESGIYVPGIFYEDDDDGSGNYYQRGREWEREARISFFEDKKKVLDQTVGIRIHGGWSRRWPQKTLRLYARNEYGASSLDHLFFGEEFDDSFKRLLLRNSGNDHHLSFIRDACAHALIHDLDLDYQTYRPSVLFINGEYWGIHNIRERQDHHYLERIYGLDRTEIDVLSNNLEVKHGDANHYNSLLDIVADSDWNQAESYDVLEQFMDVDNYLDYVILQVYVANNDWPHNNIDWWRKRVDFDSEAEPGHDGRWRWFVYDLDRSFGWITNVNTNMMTWITSPTGNGRGEWSTFLFRTLAEGEPFKEAFVLRAMDHLNTIYKPDIVHEIIERKSDGIASEMPRHIQRWSVPSSVNSWQTQLNRMKTFANNRPDRVINHIRDYFDLDNLSTVIIDIDEKTGGVVQVNSVILEQGQPGIPDGDIYPWSGRYFQSMKIDLSANAYLGFSFTYWTIDGDTIAEQKIQYIPQGDEIHVVAHFKKDEDVDFFPEPYPLASCPYVMSEWSSMADVGTFPSHMAFVYMDEEDPGLDASIAGYTEGAYNQTSRTRIEGLGEEGFAFINTGNRDGNNGYPGRQLGGAVLALDTREANEMTLWYTAKTVVKNSRDYALRLQYAFSEDGPLFDVLDSHGDPILYQGTFTGHEETVGPISLPEDMLNRPYVLLVWRYQHLSGDSGPRDMLAVDDILVFNGSDIASDSLSLALYNPRIINEQIQHICGDQPGFIALDVVDGVPPYQYIWNDNEGNSDDTVEADIPGQYTVLVTDANGCKVSKVFDIDHSFTAVDSVTLFPECSQAMNGLAQMHLSQAELPLTFQTFPGNIDTYEGVIAQWDFNGQVPSDSPSPSIGIGKAMLIGGAVNPSSGSNGVGSSDPAEENNQAWQTTNYPAQGEGTGETGVQFNISTEGYEGITFSFDQRLSNTTSTSWRVGYTIDVHADPVVWVEGEVFDIIAQHEGTGDTWFNHREVDLSHVSELDDNPNAAFRVVSVFKPGQDFYEPARWSSQYAGGTSRYDMVTVTGRPKQHVLNIENLSEGVYRIDITDAKGCLISEDISISGISAGTELSLTGSLQSMVGDSVTYRVDSQETIDSIKWNVQNGIIVDQPSEDEIIILWMIDGEGAVSAQTFLSNACVIFDTIFVEVQDMSTSMQINHDSDIDIQAYPNPCQDFIVFEAESLENFDLEIRTAGGILIASYEILGHGERINLENLSPGLYIYHIFIDEDKVLTGNFIKI